MSDVIEFRRYRQPWQKVRCPYTARGVCTAAHHTACICQNGEAAMYGLPLAAIGHAGIIDYTELAEMPWVVDFADPDLIAFAKAGEPRNPELA